MKYLFDWGQGALRLSLPGPSSLSTHLPVPALPPLGAWLGSHANPLFIANHGQLCTTPKYSCRDEKRDVSLNLTIYRQS